MIRTASVLALFCTLLPFPVLAQSTEASDSASSAAQDTALFAMKKSPLGAMVRSAIIPGWGQFYNESYWKIPLVLGLTGFLSYGIISEHNNFIEYRDLYDASITVNNPSGNLQLKQFREFYRNNRDTYGWWFLVTYLLQIADAFVDAHLYDFDISDEMHAGLVILPAGRLSVSFRW